MMCLLFLTLMEMSILDLFEDNHYLIYYRKILLLFDYYFIILFVFGLLIIRMEF
jgi:hypothetical protein